MKEFDALQALEQATASYVRRIEALSKDCEIMAEAGKSKLENLGNGAKANTLSAHGDVLAQWPEMFRILSLYGMFILPKTQDVQ